MDFFLISAPDPFVVCSDSESVNSNLLACAQAKKLASSFFSMLTSSLRGNGLFYLLKSIQSSTSTTTMLFQANITYLFHYCRSFWLARRLHSYPLQSVILSIAWLMQMIPCLSLVPDGPQGLFSQYLWTWRPFHSLHSLDPAASRLHFLPSFIMNEGQHYIDHCVPFPCTFMLSFSPMGLLGLGLLPLIFSLFTLLPLTYLYDLCLPFIQSPIKSLI